MPCRDILFHNKGIYHIFNKTVEGKKIFEYNSYTWAFLDIARYYRSSESRVSFSTFRRLRKDVKNDFIHRVAMSSTFKVNILAYCLMPTHFHFLIEQKVDDATQKFFSDILNSFTRYYNIAHKRIGPLFLPRFKAVPIMHDNQLMHISRYIHLNPYSSKLIAKKDDLINYRYSSYSYYVSDSVDPLVENEKVMELFSYNKQRYKKFVFDNAQHQQMLEAAKHAYKW